MAKLRHKPLFLLFSSCLTISAQVGSSPLGLPTRPETTAATSGALECAVSGVVVDTEEQPVKDASIYLRGTSNGVTTAYVSVSDVDGHFRIAGVSAGRYDLIVTHERYTTSEGNPSRTSGDGGGMLLVAGQHRNDVKVRLERSGVISGHVFDEANTPIVHAVLQCLRVQYGAGGRPRLGMISSTVTDDQGYYRLVALPAGRYVLVASRRSPRVMVKAERAVLDSLAQGVFTRGYGPTYFSNTPSADRAVRLSVLPGTELSGTDFRLIGRRVFRVGGTIVSSSGKPAQAAELILWPVEDATITGAPPQIGRVLDLRGTFELSDVLPGNYVLAAQDYAQGQTPEVAWFPVQVTEGDLELRVDLHKPWEIRGVIVTEGQSVTARNRRVILEPLRSTNRLHANVEGDRTFSFRNVGPGFYGVWIDGGSDDEYVKTIRLGEQDITEANLDLSAPGGDKLAITIAVDGGTVSGLVESESHEGVGGATVVIIPEGRRMAISRLYKMVTSASDGTFLLKGIAPGEYKLYAWEELDGRSLQEAEVLRPFERFAYPITIAEHSRESVMLKVIPASRAAL